MNKPDVVIIGAGGHALSIAEALRAAGFSHSAYVDEHASTIQLNGLPVLKEVPLDHAEAGGLIVVGIGDNSARERVWKDLRDRLPESHFPAVIHPSASIASDALVSPGVCILQGAIVASRAEIGTGALINSGGIVDHESVLEPFASLAPGSVIGGRVRLGARSVISMGAHVKHGVRVGADTVVGAASYVHTDLGPNLVAYGVPARPIRSRNPTDSYL